MKKKKHNTKTHAFSQEKENIIAHVHYWFGTLSYI